MTGRPRPRRLARAVLVAVLLVAVLVGLSLWALLRVGSWLVVEDPLSRAAAIVVMGGHVPFRAMEAAALYEAKWAPEVWLTRAASGPEEAALARLGLNTEIGDTPVNRVVLKRLGVPPDASEYSLLERGTRSRKSTSLRTRCGGRERIGSSSSRRSRTAAGSGPSGTP